MIRFHDACGTTGKTVAARLLPDTDLIEGIEEVCKKIILNMLMLPVLEVLKNVVICILFQKKMRKSALDMGMFCKKTAQ